MEAAAQALGSALDRAIAKVEDMHPNLEDLEDEPRTMQLMCANEFGLFSCSLEMAGALIWRFVWPEKAMSYEFEADLSTAGQVTAVCQVQNVEYALEGTVVQQQDGQLSLNYTLVPQQGAALEVSMVALNHDTFIGQWRQGKRAPQCCLLLTERNGGQWNLFSRDQQVLYKGETARVLQVL